MTVLNRYQSAWLLAFALLAVLLTTPNQARAEFFWSTDMAITGANTASGTVAGISYTITSSSTMELTTMVNTANFPAIYKVPATQSMKESTAASYTITFSQPVENPTIAIGSLGSGSVQNDFNFGASVEIVFETHFGGTSFVYNNGNASSTTSISAFEGDVIARYNSTVSSVSFNVTQPENYMTLLVGFDISADPTTSTLDASPTTVESDGTSTSTITVQTKDQFGNSFTKGGDTVTMSSTLGTLSSVTDNNDGTYTATLTSTSTGSATVSGVLNSVGMTDTASVTFNDTIGPILTISGATTPLIVGGSTHLTFTFDEDPVGFTDSDVTTVGGTLSNLVVNGGDPKIYTATFTPDPDSGGTASVTVASGSFTDAATNSGTGDSWGASFDTLAPTVTLTVPQENQISTFPVTVTFSDTVTGFTLSDVSIVGAVASNFSGSGNLYTFDVTPVPGTPITLRVPAAAAQDGSGNNNIASAVYNVSSGSAQTEFVAKEEKIAAVIQQNVAAQLQKNINVTTRQVREARSRFVLSRRGLGCSDPEARGNDCVPASPQQSVPFDVDGIARADQDGILTRGDFFGLQSSADGQSRRLVFGDFNIAARRDGSRDIAIAGRMAWERTHAEHMTGFYVGLDLTSSTLAGDFTGDQDGVGLNGGAYVVAQISPHLVAEGFIGLGASKYSLSMTDGVLDLETTYTSLSGTIGGGVTGLFDLGAFEFWPSISISYARSFVGPIGFTGTAYGVTDNKLSLSADDISIGMANFTPEFRIPLKFGKTSDGAYTASIAPSIFCAHRVEDDTSNSCGQGLEMGLIHQGASGDSRSIARLGLSKIGDTISKTFNLNVEHRF